MCGQTTTTNRPIQLWVVFTCHKPLMLLLSEQISLKTHQSGQVVGGNNGLGIFYQKIASNMVENFPIHLFKPFG
jgi:hypothetical protein